MPSISAADAPQEATAPQQAPHIHIMLADGGGWLLRTEQDGRPVATEHYSDWHRLERRIAVLRGSMAPHLVRIAVVVVAALILVASAAAQDAPSALLPEPRIITNAVDGVTGFTGGEGSAPRDGFYAHTGQMITGAGRIPLGPGYGTWAPLSAAVIGKPLGILTATALAVALGLHLSPRLHWRHLVVVALATSGGFTFGLFFATAVFPVGPILAELKIGAVATGIGVPLAFATARLLHAGRFGRHAHHARVAHTEQ
jgi:hypothetical protein